MYVYRSCIHIFNREQATFVHKSSGAGEGNEPECKFGTWETFVCYEETCTDAWEWDFEVQRSCLGTTEEDCGTGILYGQSQGK